VECSSLSSCSRCRSCARRRRRAGSVACAFTQPDTGGRLLEKARRLIDEAALRKPSRCSGSPPPRDPRVRVSWPSRATTRTTPARDRGADRRPPLSLPRISMARGRPSGAGPLALPGRHLGDAIPFLEQTRAFAPENSDLAVHLGMAYIQTASRTRRAQTLGPRLPRPADSAAGHLVRRADDGARGDGGDGARRS